MRSIHAGGKFGERFGWHAREAAGCLHKASPAQPDEGAFRGGSGKRPARSVSAVASAMAGATKGKLRQVNCACPHALDPRRRKLRLALRVARPRGGGLLASGARRGRVRRRFGHPAVRSVSARDFPSASQKQSVAVQEGPRQRRSVRFSPGATAGRKRTRLAFAGRCYEPLRSGFFRRPRPYTPPYPLPCPGVCQ